METDLDALLPHGLARRSGPPIAPPADYADGYTLPAHTVKPLQQLHSHPLDEHIEFFEEPHIYTFDGVPTTTSVTSLAHRYESPFEARTAIALMKSSRSQAWPRLAYVRGARALPATAAGWTPGRGVLRVCAGKTVAVLQPGSLRAEATAENVVQMLDLATIASNLPPGEEAELHEYEREMTDQEIADGWTLNGKIASHMGTEAHYGAELFFNGLPFRWWDPDMRVLLDFCRTRLLPRGIVGYNTEKEIICADADVAGSLDLIVYDSALDLYHIIDHKRSEKLATQMRGYGKMLKPFSHLDDCKGASYALQTSIYQYVLEREYGMRIGDRVLLSLHAEKPYATSVPYLRAEAAFLMENRFALVEARRAVAKAEPERFRCALTGAPAVDAVRLADGTLAMEKVAVVRKLDHEPDAATREAFEAAVQARYNEVPLRREECVSWRRLMPEGGLTPLA